jgi:hypothetical protein
MLSRCTGFRKTEIVYYHSDTERSRSVTISQKHASTSFGIKLIKYFLRPLLVFSSKISNYMTQPQRSRFITNLALFSIMVGIYLMFQNILSFMTTNSLENNIEYQMAQQLMPTLSVSPTATIFEIVLQFAGIIASIGLYMRLNWGRISYMVLLSVITVWGIVSSIMSYLSLSKYLHGYGIESSLSLMVFGNILALGINIYLIWKLSTNEIRNEFLTR